MDSLPSEIFNFIQQFRPLFRAEVFDTFTYLLLGLLIGEAKHGAVRSSVFAPAHYQPSRISDFFCRHKLSHQALMQTLTAQLLAALYAQLPARLFWIADSTTTEKPFAERVASIGLFHRSKRVAGRAKHLKGHCLVFAAHLFESHRQGARRFASFLCGALLYVKGRTIPELVVALAHQLRLPASVRHVWVVDRGILSRTLLRGLEGLEQYALGRARCNQVVYFAPQRKAQRGRAPLYGEKCRLDQLPSRFPKRLRQQSLKLMVWGKVRLVKVADCQALLRGVWQGGAVKVRVLIVDVPELKKLKPWYLITTDLELDPLEAVRVYSGRAQIEVNFDEAKELGLGHYQGRSAQGVRRWPLLICLAQTVLKLVATGVVDVALPQLNWSWYQREDTLGQVRRRLIELCRPRISRTLGAIPIWEKFKKAA